MNHSLPDSAVANPSTEGVDMENQICKTCGEEKPLSEFYVARGYPFRSCKKCCIAKASLRDPSLRRKEHHECLFCGQPFLGRKYQKTCSRRCSGAMTRSYQIALGVGPTYVFTGTYSTNERATKNRAYRAARPDIARAQRITQTLNPMAVSKVPQSCGSSPT
jgi:hypothetical protein